MSEPLPLPGCTPKPLMAYLKALGVFRLVVEQKADPEARLSWSGGSACLHTALGRDGLTDFFLSHYRPTPIIGPWGARSGFYPGASESSARRAIEAIAASSDPRLAPFRAVIDGVRSLLARLGVSDKAALEQGDNYMRLLRDLRNELPDEVIDNHVGDWLDAVYTVGDDRKFPPLLGTGGNEGSGSYMSNFCQTVADLIIDRSTDAGVEAALFGTPSAVRQNIFVGHFDPTAIGGPNSSVGFDWGGGGNPWDYLLAIEGTLLFRSAPARRLGTDTAGKAAFPFTVDPNPVGYGSAAAAEDVRAELWMPEWPTPVGLSELQHFLNEGRAQLGRRQARTAVEFARAAVTLGTSRGVTAFHRYGLVKRNGLNFFASHLERFPVQEVPDARLADELDGWLGPYRRLADGKDAPPRFAAAVHHIDEAVYNVCRYRADAPRLQAVLRAVGRAERELANAARLRAEIPGLRPLAGLSSRWLTACDDGSSEYRLALSMAVMPGRGGRYRPFRAYMEPVASAGKSWFFDDSASGVVWSNTSLPENLGAVLARRLRDGAGGDDEPSSCHPLWTPGRFRPVLADVMRFLNAETDDDVLTDLVWALPAVELSHRGFRYRQPTAQEPRHTPVDYAVLKLVFLAEVVTRPGAADGVPVRNEQRAVVLLQAGRLDEAVALACRRLQSAGLPPYLTAPVAGLAKPVRGLPSSPARTRRLAAALLFPLRPAAVRRLAELSLREANPNPF